MNENILLVEDDDAISDALRIHLEEAGYRLYRERDGLNAIQSIDRQSWDLVLLDIMLPGVDGWVVCRHLRNLYANTPIIMLSARSAETHRVLGLELGADDFLAKPFSMLELIARIRALLRRIDQIKATPNDQNEFRFGKFILNVSMREIILDGRKIPLTLREFDLLHFLLKNPSRVFSRDELLQRVWGAAFDGYDHTVNSHINRLRCKIEDDPRAPLHIVTVWGVGYRFDLQPRK